MGIFSSTKKGFDEIRSYNEGLAAARKGKRWGFINRKQEEVIPFLFEKAGDFCCGIAIVKLNGKLHTIDTKGKFEELNDKFVYIRLAKTGKFITPGVSIAIFGDEGDTDSTVVVDFGGEDPKKTKKFLQEQVESIVTIKWGLAMEDVRLQIWQTLEMKGLGVDLKDVLNTLGAALVTYFGDEHPVANYKFNKKYKGLIIFAEYSNGTSFCIEALSPYSVEEVGMTKKQINNLIEAYEW